MNVMAWPVKPTCLPCDQSKALHPPLHCELSLPKFDTHPNFVGPKIYNVKFDTHPTLSNGKGLDTFEGLRVKAE